MSNNSTTNGATNVAATASVLDESERVRVLTAERDLLKRQLAQLKRERDELHGMICHQVTKDLTAEQLEAEINAILAHPELHSDRFTDLLDELERENQTSA